MQRVLPCLPWRKVPEPRSPPSSVREAKAKTREVHTAPRRGGAPIETQPGEVPSGRQIPGGLGGVRNRMKEMGHFSNETEGPARCSSVEQPSICLSDTELSAELACHNAKNRDKSEANAEHGVSRHPSESHQVPYARYHLCILAPESV